MISLYITRLGIWFVAVGVLICLVVCWCLVYWFGSGSCVIAGFGYYVVVWL